MAIIDPGVKYATATFPGAGTNGPFEFNFTGGYLSQDHVFAFISNDVTEVQTPVSLTFTGPNTVTTSAVVPTGSTLYIYRNTPKDTPLAAFTDGVRFTARNLNTDYKQAVFGLAELVDRIGDAAALAGQAVELQPLIEQLYQQVLNLLNASGVISVDPRVWAGVGDGVNTDFPIDGADVSNAGFYDTYLNGLGLDPDTDYQILLGDQNTGPVIRFTAAPADGAKWFTVLRGYAKPYSGGAPITSLKLPVVSIASAYTVPKAVEYGLVRSTAASPITVTLPSRPVNGSDADYMGTGSYVSIAQRGGGQITLVGDGTSTLVVPAGCNPKTRAVGSVISATCEDADTNVWIVSGDLERVAT